MPEASEEVLRLGSRILRTCRQISDEVAPYVYGQQQFLFYRPRQTLGWLDRIGQNQVRLRHVAVLGYSIPYETLEDTGEILLPMWASVLRRFSAIESLYCLARHLEARWQPFNWSNTIWDNEVVLEALRDLLYVRVISVEATGIECSLELTRNKPFLETLVLTGHPIAGLEWYPEDYFDRLIALKHLTIWNGGLRMQSGNSKVSNHFFSHITPLRSFTWHGFNLTDPHRKAFTTRHGGTIQFLELNMPVKYWEDRAARRSEESTCLDSLTNMFGAMPVLKALTLHYWHDCVRLLENMPPSLTVLSLNGGAQDTDVPDAVRTDELLGHALRKLPYRCPQLAHVRLNMIQQIVDEDQMGRCGMLSIHSHAALESLLSKIKDTFVTNCVARRCNEVALHDMELTEKILQCWHGLPHYPICKTSLDHPWERDYAVLDSVIGLE